MSDGAPQDLPKYPPMERRGFVECAGAKAITDPQLSQALRPLLSLCEAGERRRPMRDTSSGMDKTELKRRMHGRMDTPAAPLDPLNAMIGVLGAGLSGDGYDGYDEDSGSASSGRCRRTSARFVADTRRATGTAVRSLGRPGVAVPPGWRGPGGTGCP